MAGIIRVFTERIHHVMIQATRYNVAKLIPLFMKQRWKSSIGVNVEEIRDRLEQYSPKPIGRTVWNRPASDCDDRPDLSIIIPFYNTEAFAVRCIESVTTQKTTYRFEIILVDDGSPDKCGEIIDSYAHYDNVRIIHQANKGFSGARNTGIAIATGKYLMFVDSDDLLCENAVQVLMDTAYNEDADIVEGSRITITNLGVERHHRLSYNKSAHGSGMSGFAWGKVIRASLFDHICFPEQYYFEDTVIAGVLYKLAGTTVTIPEEVYKYYINYKGISLSSHKKPKAVDTYYIIEELIDTWKCLKIPIDHSLRVALIYQLSSYVYRRTGRLGKDILYAQFILSCDLLEKNDLYPSEVENFYVNELIEAFKKRQFGRWKYAARYL